MSYIIIWRHNTREPFVGFNDRGFMEQYSSYEEAKKSADETEKIENENRMSEWYFSPKIFKES